MATTEERQELRGWRREMAPFLAETRYAFRLFRANKLVLAGSILATVAIGLGIVGPFIVDPRIAGIVDLNQRLLPPSADHIFGTDDQGRDILAMIVLGLRLDITAALILITAGLAIGIGLGAVAGFSGGKVDEALMRVTDVFLAFPLLILAMAIAAVLGRNVNNTILAILIVIWPSYARLVRGQVLSEKQKLYVEALRALGASPVRIIAKHLLPNVIYPVLVQATLDIGGVIILFAALGFLGFGVGPFEAELGRMVAVGSSFITIAPWLITFPGSAIVLTSLAFNLLGDGLRDIMDPRLRR